MRRACHRFRSGCYIAFPERELFLVFATDAESNLRSVLAVVFLVLDAYTADFANPATIVGKIEIPDAEGFKERANALIGFLAVIAVEYEIEPKLATMPGNIERNLKALVTGAECF